MPNNSSFVRSSSCDGRLALSWNAPVGEGENIASFKIQWRTAQQSFSDTERTVNVDGDATSYTIDQSLENGVTYIVRIVGLDDQGQALWSQEGEGTPSGGSCIASVEFGAILADSAPVIVVVAAAQTGTPVNMQYRSLNPGEWSEVITKLLEEGSDRVTFDIRGLSPDNRYEVRTWLGDASDPPDREDESGTQVVFEAGTVPEGTRFTGGGGGGSVAKVLRIEPSIRSVTLSAGDEVMLSVDVYGRQGIHDNSLLDGAPEDGRPALDWTSDGGGSFAEAETRSGSSNGIADDRRIIFTAPEDSGTFRVTAGFASDFHCLAVQEDETEDEAAARCTAEFEITVRRSPHVEPTSTIGPRNPAGEIPSVLVDDSGTNYEVFTPEDGGEFVAGACSFSVPSGAVNDGELIGISVAESAPGGELVAANDARFLLGDAQCSISAVDAASDPVADYILRAPGQICMSIPDEFRSRAVDAYVIAFSPDGEPTQLTSKLFLTRTIEGVKVCGNLGFVPADTLVALPSNVYRELPPTPEPLPTPELSDLDTGGRSFSPMVALIGMLFGVGVVGAISVVVIGRRRSLG